MAGHTPAPWTYQPEEHLGRPGDEPNFFTIHNAQGRYFADVHVLVGEADHTRAEADARLIAAAPELLEALRLFANLPAEGPPPGVMRAPWEKAIAALVAAIAKATGEAAP